MSEPTCPTHGVPLVTPDSRPYARDYTGAWCRVCSPRCDSCGTLKRDTPHSRWGDRCCSPCAANRAGA